MQDALLFISFSLAVAALPGPSSLFVASQGLSGGIRSIFFALVGIAFANLIWLTLSLTGIAVLIATFEGAIEMIRLVGMFYLVYLGCKLLRSAGANTVEESTRDKRVWIICFQGFLTSITNPKAVLFYAAFLPQFVPQGVSVPQQMTLLGLGYIAIALTVFLLYGLFAAYIAGKVKRVSAPFKRVVGLGFILSAISLWRWRPQ